MGKENAAFVAETTELKQAIAALQKAITILVKGTSSAFLQGNLGTTSSTSMERDAVKAFVQAVPVMKGVNDHQVSLLALFSKENAKANYAPQSETIQGILKDMYDTMTSNLESSTSDEANAGRQFETLIAIKTE